MYTDKNSARDSGTRMQLITNIVHDQLQKNREIHMF